MTCGSNAAATKIVSIPLLIGVVKILAICRPIKNANATTTGVYSQLLLYAGEVKIRYR